MYLKLEGYNPTGSIKDRACTFMLRAMREEGKLLPGMTLLDASSGNFACALAFYGKMAGYRSAVAVSSKLTAAKREFLLYLGATIHPVGDFTIQGNDFCRSLAEHHPDEYCFLDQLHNWNNPRAHLESTGPEILAAFPDVGMVVGSLGSGGTMMGVSQFLKATAPHVSIVVVECAPGNRIPGTGSFQEGDWITPFIRKGYDEAYFDACVRVTEADAAHSTRFLLQQGFFCGLQTGGVVHAAVSYTASHRIEGSVVILSGDTGWKNLDKLLALPVPSPK
jgi:cysteine synthase